MATLAFSWGNNSPSKKTFDILHALGELEGGISFEAAGPLSVKELLYWPHVDLSFLRQSAFGTARKFTAALYSDVVTPKKTTTKRGDVLKAIFEVLIKDASTVTSIARVLDDLIHFPS
jgi:hypothetical protein